MNKVHYDVTGLINTNMKTQLKNALDDLDGVKKVNVDLVQSCIDVGYNDSTDENDIKQCIEHVGCKIES